MYTDKCPDSIRGYFGLPTEEEIKEHVKHMSYSAPRMKDVMNETAWVKKLHNTKFMTWE